MKPQIVAELVNYKSRMVPFMPRRQNTGQRTRFLCDFFNDDRGSCNCSTAAGSHDARESAGELKRFPLAQLLTSATQVVAWINQSIAARLIVYSKSKCSRTSNAANWYMLHPGECSGIGFCPFALQPVRIVPILAACVSTRRSAVFVVGN
jgi:hypothetical protein